MFHIMIFGVVVVGLLYTILRLIIPAKFGRKQTMILSAAYVFVGLMYPTYQYIEHSDFWWIYLWGWIAGLAIGAISSTVALTLLKDALLIILAIVKIKVNKRLNRVIFYSILTISSLCTLLGYIQATTPQIVKIELSTNERSLDGFTIVQMTDTHLTKLVNQRWLDKVVDIANSQVPDIAVITGDFADIMLPDTDSVLNGFKNLNAKYGTYGVLGNHEYHGGQSKLWIDKMNSLGVMILENNNTIINHNGTDILLAGITDNAAAYTKQIKPDVNKAIESNSLTAMQILLSHQPQNANDAAKVGFDLTLSGHTHGGQFFPWNFLVANAQEYFKGLYQIGDMSLYINQGTGYWDIPNRLGTKSEITVIKFKFNQ